MVGDGIHEFARGASAFLYQSKRASSRAARRVGRVFMVGRDAANHLKRANCLGQSPVQVEVFTDYARHGPAYGAAGLS